MAVYALRGAVQADADSGPAIISATSALITEMIARNGLESGAIISMLLTATADLRAAFPAQAARELGLTSVPLMCTVEMDVRGALPRVIRVLMHVNAEQQPQQHVYLGGAAVLRPDLAAAGALP